ncbi:hypothetical protein GCM10009806_07880 [Microbacterium flavum]
MPYSAAACVIAPILAAPSSIEYSLCTCRWTKESDGTTRVYEEHPTSRVALAASGPGDLTLESNLTPAR